MPIGTSSKLRHSSAPGRSRRMSVSSGARMIGHWEPTSESYHRTFPRTSLYGKDGDPSMSTILTNKSPRRPPPSIENGKVGPPRRVANLERRSREHLTPTEVERLVKAAGKVGRHGPRDATLILIAYRHGLRVGELVGLRWEQVDLQRGTLHVNRTKNGEAGTHPLTGRELRTLRQLKRLYGDSPFLFVT